MTRAIAIIALLGSTVAGAQMPAGHPPMPTEPTTPIEGGHTAMSTQLMEVTAEGVVRPLVGAEGWLIAGLTRPGPHGPQSSTLDRHRAVSDSNGMLAFKNVKVLAGVRYRITVVFQGVTVRSNEFSAGSPPPREMLIHHVTTRTDALTLSVHWTVDVGEAFLQVTQVVRTHNKSGMTIDYTHAPLGLRMPTLSFPVFGRVATWGIYPLGKVHGSPQPSTGQGQLLGEKGAVVFRGPVPPGGDLFFQFRYNVPYENETLELATVSDLPVEDAAVTFQHTALVEPRMRMVQEHRAIRTTRDNLVRQDFIIGSGLKAGQPMRLQLDRLPIQTKMPVWLATGGFLLGVFTFLGVLVGAIGRRRMS